MKQNANNTIRKGDEGIKKGRKLKYKWRKSEGSEECENIGRV
jgi:hypothetical protein